MNVQIDCFYKCFYNKLYSQQYLPAAVFHLEKVFSESAYFVCWFSWRDCFLRHNGSKVVIWYYWNIPYLGIPDYITTTDWKKDGFIDYGLSTCLWQEKINYWIILCGNSNELRLRMIKKGSRYGVFEKVCHDGTFMTFCSSSTMCL